MPETDLQFIERMRDKPVQDSFKGGYMLLPVEDFRRLLSFGEHSVSRGEPVTYNAAGKKCCGYCGDQLGSVFDACSCTPSVRTIRVMA